jgi:hypothetical protein
VTCNICNEKHNTLLHTQQKSTAPLIQSEDNVVNNFCKTRDISGLLSTAIAIYSAFFLTVAIGNCMVKLIPPVNFCSDENIQTIFGTKFEDFFKLSDR